MIQIFMLTKSFNTEPHVEFYKPSSFPYPSSLRHISLFFSHINLNIESRLIPSYFLTKTLCNIFFSLLPLTFSTLRTVLVFGHPINTWRGMKAMNLIFMRYSASSSLSLPLISINSTENITYKIISSGNNDGSIVRVYA